MIRITVSGVSSKQFSALSSFVESEKNCFYGEYGTFEGKIVSIRKVRGIENSGKDRELYLTVKIAIRTFLSGGEIRIGSRKAEKIPYEGLPINLLYVNRVWECLEIFSNIPTDDRKQ